MKRVFCISILIMLASAYIISVICLNDVKILAGNITPIVNFKALAVLTVFGLVAGIFLAKLNKPFVLFKNNQGIKRSGIYILLIILILFRFFVFLLFPRFVQFMRVWPDSIKYLTDMQTVLQNPVRIFDTKSLVYTIWLILNHLIGKITGIQGGSTYFGVTIFYSDIIPTIFSQIVISIFSAVICLKIFSRINIGLAYTVTLLAFLNPTSIAIENTILRESLALFFVLSGFLLFLKTIEQKKVVYGLMSGFLFILAYETRLELIIIYIFLCFNLFIYILFQKQKMWGSLILFSLPLVSSILFIGSKYKGINEEIYGGRYNLAIYGLKSKCYFYESPIFPELIRNIQKRATQCEHERGSPCEAPAGTMFVFRSYMVEEIDKYIQNSNLKTTKAEVLDQIFLDVIRNNTFSYIRSVGANIGYNLIHNVQNTSPILYDGDNYWISQNWNYYVSPKMLALYEKDSTYNKYIVYLFRAIELYTVRKILYPFFLIGSVMIIFKIKSKAFNDYNNSSLFFICLLLISWGHLLFISIIADTVARFTHPISPFIFAIEIIGVIGLYNYIKLFFLNR